MCKLSKLNRRNDGFSLVELIVVIVILAVLIGVSISGVYEYLVKARRHTDIHNCQVLKDSIWLSCGDKKFPALGYDYSFTSIANKNASGKYNIFSGAFVFGETVGKTDESLDYLKVDFQELIKASYTVPPEINGNIPFELKAGGYLFITICVDEEGKCVNVAVGVLEPSTVLSRNTYWKLGMLYHPNVENVWEIYNVWNDIWYDGVHKLLMEDVDY